MHTSRKRMARLSTMTHSACCAVNGAGAAEVCGLRTRPRMQICSNCLIHGLTVNRFFLFTGRDVAITMNSVKILHAARSAITAIAELLVVFVLQCSDESPSSVLNENIFGMPCETFSGHLIYTTS